MHFRAMVMVFLSAAFVAQANAAESLKVDTKGVTAQILYEAPISGGHISELKDRYKLRVTEISIAPGGYVGAHNHLGPGIRQMTVGEMEYILPDKTVTYRPGDFFFETGEPPSNQQIQRSLQASVVRNFTSGFAGSIPHRSQG